MTMVRKGLSRLYFKKTGWIGDTDINITYLIWIFKKSKREPTIIWKRVNCQRITSKNTRPWWVDTWARDMVRWYWSADTLFWQLSIDDNINVQSASSWAPKVARKCESKHWYACGADGRLVGRSVTWLPNFLGWVDLFTHGAPLAHFVRGAPLWINKQIHWLINLNYRLLVENSVIQSVVQKRTLKCACIYYIVIVF